MRTRSLVSSTIALVALALFSAPAPAAAQATIGVKGGINLARLSFADGTVNDWNTGLVGGAFFGGNHEKRVSFRVEALLSIKGAKDGATTYKFTYLEIPVLARYNFASSAHARASVFGGPAVAFRLQAKASGGQAGDLKDAVESIDMGAVVGAGVEINKLVVDARYEFGLLNLLKNATDMTEFIKNQCITVMVGVRFK